MKSLKPASMFLVIALISAAMAAPAWAEKGGHGHGNGKPHERSHDGASKEATINAQVVVQIGESDRTIIQQYIADGYRSHCPPGLAKKRNGCLPPGQAKKRYTIGRALSKNVTWKPVSDSLLVRLQPIPAGYRYVQVDKDVLLISEASHKVIDAITLLTAVGK